MADESDGQIFISSASGSDFIASTTHILFIDTTDNNRGHNFWMQMWFVQCFIIVQIPSEQFGSYLPVKARSNILIMQCILGIVY